MASSSGWRCRRRWKKAHPASCTPPAAAIPALRVGPAAVRVLVGEAFGARSPVEAFSRIVYLDIQLDAGVPLVLPALAQELAVYAVDGALTVDGEAVPAHTLAVLPDGQGATLQADTPVRLMVLGGDALDGPRFLWWNFVSTRKERVAQAAADWQAQRMGRIDGETEFIPLPAQPLPG